MGYCIYCGGFLSDGAKFCQQCGKPVSSRTNATSTRQIEFEGTIHKCPNCGEELKAFTRNCPTCGFEFRSSKASSAMKEFEQKIEKLEEQRVYEKPEKGLFGTINAREHISKTDEQIISVIQNFAVPNTKEDILEFIILASSNIVYEYYDNYTNYQVNAGKKAVNHAWKSKMEQAYDKARYSYGNQEDFRNIEEIYLNSIKRIKKNKRNGIIKISAVPAIIVLSIPMLMVVVTVISSIHVKQETKRLEQIETEAQRDLEQGNYKSALLNAERLEYDMSIGGSSVAEKKDKEWDVRRELLIDEIISEAETQGIHLEYNND